SVLTGVAMYSLQFNLTVTPSDGPPITVAPAPVEFFSMLQQAVVPIEGTKLPPGSQQWFRQIPTAMFLRYSTNFVGTNLVLTSIFRDLRFTNAIASSNAILLVVAWLERWGPANLFYT